MHWIDFGNVPEWIAATATIVAVVAAWRAYRSQTKEHGEAMSRLSGQHHLELKASRDERDAAVRRHHAELATAKTQHEATIAEMRSQQLREMRLDAYSGLLLAASEMQQAFESEMKRSQYSNTGMYDSEVDPHIQRVLLAHKRVRLVHGGEAAPGVNRIAATALALSILPGQLSGIQSVGNRRPVAKKASEDIDHAIKRLVESASEALGIESHDESL